VLNGYYPPGESLIDWHWLRRKEITLYCPDSRTPERLKATLGLMEGGQLRVVELITHRLHAERAPVAYGMLLDPGARFLGMVLEWEGRYVQG
jgi:hypothetical protein